MSRKVKFVVEEVFNTKEISDRKRKLEDLFIDIIVKSEMQNN